MEKTKQRLQMEVEDLTLDLEKVRAQAWPELRGFPMVVLCQSVAFHARLCPCTEHAWAALPIPGVSCRLETAPCPKDLPSESWTSGQSNMG